MTVVECDNWSIDYTGPVPELELYKNKDGKKILIAIFFINNIAGFKEVDENKVQWSKQDECPITPEQFNSIYEDKEGEADEQSE